ncbi:uncharacterized protein LOC141649401 [Silene latifolia]|uniref:uncharacterized protein LOC141649401 n=1 Tax=Silene latifolia TaxID=37657 RepID=UPI003D76B24B
MLENKIDCGAVLETHVKSNAIQEIYNRSFSSYRLVHNSGAHANGRIWVLWQPRSVALTVLFTSAQHIHCEVTHFATGKVVNIIYVYGFNTRTDRHELWDTLKTISASILSPWIFMGDFNVVRAVDERLGTANFHLADMNDFKSCLEDSGLVDRPTTRCHYTWNNKQGDGLRWAKLDRIMISSTWFSSLSSVASYHPSGVSDHSPGVVKLLATHGNCGRQFRYMNCWALSPHFQQCIHHEWHASCNGGRIFTLFNKLKRLKSGLKRLHSNTFSNLAERIKQAKQSLLSCQMDIQHDPMDSSLYSKEKECL